MQKEKQQVTRHTHIRENKIKPKTAYPNTFKRPKSQRIERGGKERENVVVSK